MDSRLARALAVLWVKRGDAEDMVLMIKRSARDPRRADLPQIEAMLALLVERLTEEDLIGAVDVASKLDRLTEKANHRVLAPFVTTGRKIRASNKTRREGWNARRLADRSHAWNQWQSLASDFWSKNPTASNNAAARFIKTKLKLSESARTIARHIKKLGRTS